MIARVFSVLLALLLLVGPARADVGSPALIFAGEVPEEINTGIYMDVDPDSCPGVDSSVTEYQFLRYDNHVAGFPAVPAFTSAWQGTGGSGNTYLDTAVTSMPPQTRHNYKACCRNNVTQTGGGCTSVYPLLNSMDGIGYGPPSVFVHANGLPWELGTTWIRARSQLGIAQFYERQLPFLYRWKWGKLSDPVSSWQISSATINNWRDFTSADGLQPNTWYCFLSDIMDQAGNSSGFLPSTTSLWPGGALCAKTFGTRTETLRWTQAASPVTIVGWEVDYGTTTELGTVVNLQAPVPALGQYTKNITVNSGQAFYFALRAYAGTFASGQRSANSNMIYRTIP